jgi:hypothetical protein
VILTQNNWAPVPSRWHSFFIPQGQLAPSQGYQFATLQGHQFATSQGYHQGHQQGQGQIQGHFGSSQSLSHHHFTFAQ